MCSDLPSVLRTGTEGSSSEEWLLPWGVASLDGCPWLWKVQNGVSGGGFSRGQSWPVMPWPLTTVLPVVESVAVYAPEVRLLP